MRTASRPAVTFYWRIPCSFIRRPFLCDVASLARASRARLVASSCPPPTKSIAPCSTTKRLSFKPKATIADSLGWCAALPQGAGRQLVTWLPLQAAANLLAENVVGDVPPLQTIKSARRNWLSQNQDPANQGSDEGLLAWRQWLQQASSRQANVTDVLELQVHHLSGDICALVAQRRPKRPSRTTSMASPTPW